MARWPSRISVLGSNDGIAAIWGEIAASAERRDSPPTNAYARKHKIPLS
jgi:hypothetical protein